MAGSRTQLQAYIEDEINRYKGVCMPVKVSLPHRVFIKIAACKKLHPNPDDEFYNPNTGPNYAIISDYEQQIRDVKAHAQQVFIKEPLIVEKMYPDGYMILNGHHRWAAAMRMSLPRVPVRIVNLTQAENIERMLRNAKHDKRVGLDEVVFLADGEGAAENPLPFPLNRIYKERLRRGIPAPFHFLKTNGYDLWVYTAKYYSMEYIRKYFRRYRVQVDGIVTGTARKEGADKAKMAELRTRIANRYLETIHIDSHALLRVDSASKAYEEYSLKGDPNTWSREVMEIIGAFESHEGQANRG